jgi:hypothetical protein
MESDAARFRQVLHRGWSCGFGQARISVFLI